MFTKLFVTLTLVIMAAQVSAVPVIPRQSALGANVSLDCALNRLTIVSGLIETKLTLKDIQPLVVDDDETAAAIKTTIDGISKAQGGIGTIFKAIVAGDKPPAEARQIVIDGLNTGGVALRGINTTSEEITALVEQAQSEFLLAGKAGDGVLATCT